MNDLERYYTEWQQSYVTSEKLINTWLAHVPNQPLQQVTINQIVLAQERELAKLEFLLSHMTATNIREGRCNPAMELKNTPAIAYANWDGHEYTISLACIPKYPDSRKFIVSHRIIASLNDAIKDCPLESPMIRADIIIQAGYPYGTKLMLDPDNIDIRSILNALKGKVIADDTLKTISLKIEGIISVEPSLMIRIIHQNTEENEQSK